MKYIKYFTQFLLVMVFFFIFRILGANLSSNISGKIFEKIGPYFRSKKIIQRNIKRAFPNITNEKLDGITKSMWNNYGRTFAEYIFIKDFRFGKLKSNIIIKGEEIIDEIKKKMNKLFLYLDILVILS